MGPRLRHHYSQCSRRAVGLGLSLSHPNSQAEEEAEIMGFVPALSPDPGTPRVSLQGNVCKGKALLRLTGGFAVCFRYFYRYVPKGENTQLSTSQHCHIPSTGVNQERARDPHCPSGRVRLRKMKHPAYGHTGHQLNWLNWLNRTTEPFGVEGAFKGHLVQPPSRDNNEGSSILKDNKY